MLFYINDLVIIVCMNFYGKKIVFLAFENLVIALTKFALVIYLMHLHLNCRFSAFRSLKTRIVMAIHFDKAVDENIIYTGWPFFLSCPFLFVLLACAFTDLSKEVNWYTMNWTLLQVCFQSWNLVTDLNSCIASFGLTLYAFHWPLCTRNYVNPLRVMNNLGAWPLAAEAIYYARPSLRKNRGLVAIVSHHYVSNQRH